MYDKSGANGVKRDWQVISKRQAECERQRGRVCMSMCEPVCACEAGNQTG